MSSAVGYDDPSIEGEARAQDEIESRAGGQIGRAAPGWESSLSIDLAPDPSPPPSRGQALSAEF
jgi:hypothetical protein